MASPTVSRGLESPLKVLYVIPGEPEGHNMVFARAAASELRRLNVSVREFYLRSRNVPLEVWRELRRLRREVRDFDPAIVHAQYGSVTGLVTMLAAGGHRTVLSVRGSDLNKVPSVNRLRNFLGRLMTRLAALRADAVVCVSSALLSQLWAAEHKSQVIASGVDTEVFFPADRAAARATLEISKTAKVILFYAGQAPILKGLPLVEQAMVLVNQAWSDAQLQVLRGGLSRRDVARWMNASDCLVLASEAEGSPNVVREAMACNLPVVSVPVGDVMERLARVKPSCVVERTPQALAEAISYVISEGIRSNGSIEIDRQLLSQVHTTDALCRLYRRVAGG